MKIDWYNAQITNQILLNNKQIENTYELFRQKMRYNKTYFEKIEYMYQPYAWEND